MTDAVPQADLIDQLAEEFLRRFRQGERPAVQEYAAKYPEHAAQIRDLFPALVVLEHAAPASDSEPPRTDNAPAAGLPEQLGDYRIVREIGRGGMGVVYEAEQQSLGRRVALKVLAASTLLEPKQLQRFHREAKAAARLHHTNIVPVFGVGEHDGRHYYVMQFIEGLGLDEVLDEVKRLRGQPSAVGAGPAASVARSLLTDTFTQESPPPVSPRPESARGALKRSAPLADSGRGETVSSSHLAGQTQTAYPRAVARLGVQAAEALEYAHAQGVLHRDVKPSNLLLDNHGILWITDFGLAKAADSADLTHTGDIIGTVRYMAPERFRGECDARADVYALGLTLYELLTLRPAFDAADRLTLIDHIANREPPRPRGLDPRIPRDLETIVMTAIDKEPPRRYQSAEALATDLRRFLADEPITARRVGPAERLVRWGRRNPVVAGLTAAVVFVTALGFAATAAQTRTAQDERNTAKEQRDEAQQQRDEARALAEKLQAALEQLRRTNYAAHMNLAKHAWDEDGIPRVLELLDQHRPKAGADDLRGFEWHYLNRLCHSELLTLTGHTGAVYGLDFSPDGKRLASAGGPEVKVWDAQTGRALLTIIKGGFGRRLNDSGGGGVAFSPDGKRLASGAKVWDAQTGQELLTVKNGHMVVFSPDGQRLAGSEFPKVKVWDAQTGQELRTFEGPGYPSHVAFSPDGKRLAGALYSADSDSTVKIWDAQTGRELHSLKSRVNHVAFSPDGQRLAGASFGGTVRVWDAKTGRETLTLKANDSAYFSGVAFSPDGRSLVCAGQTLLQIWDLQTGRAVRTLKGGGWVVKFSPDGRRLASGSGNKVKVWDAQKDQESLALPMGDGTTFAFSPDWRRLASATRDDTVEVRDVQTGETVLRLKGHTAPVAALAFSPEGRRLASGGGGRRTNGGVSPYEGVADLRVWDLQTGQELLALKGLAGSVQCVAFSPDGKRLATASSDVIPQGPFAVRVWDAQTGQELLALTSPGGFPSICVAFSPDGKRLATGGREGKVWDALTGRELLTLKGGRGVASIVFSPDGKRLASGGGTEGKVWDAQTGEELFALKGHNNRVFSVAFSPDSKRLASAARDGIMRVWDVQSGQQLITLKGGYFGAAFSPDGHRLASVSLGHTLTIWDATPLPEKP